MQGFPVGGSGIQHLSSLGSVICLVMDDAQPKASLESDRKPLASNEQRNDHETPNLQV